VGVTRSSTWPGWQPHFRQAEAWQGTVYGGWRWHCAQCSDGMAIARAMSRMHRCRS
jgi:hypothetical protein